MDTIALQKKLAEFCDERDWNQFHNPKNLVMALSVECSELVEEFQWLTPEQSSAIMQDPEAAERVKNEIADITAYLLRLTDKLGIDLEAAVTNKLKINEKKYPTEEFKGTARKYNR